MPDSNLQRKQRGEANKCPCWSQSQDIVALPPESQKFSSHIPQTGAQAVGGASRRGVGGAARLLMLSAQETGDEEVGSEDRCLSTPAFPILPAPSFLQVKIESMWPAGAQAFIVGDGPSLQIMWTFSVQTAFSSLEHSEQTGT